MKKGISGFLIGTLFVGLGIGMLSARIRVVRRPRGSVAAGIFGGLMLTSVLASQQSRYVRFRNLAEQNREKINDLTKEIDAMFKKLDDWSKDIEHRIGELENKI